MSAITLYQCIRYAVDSCCDAGLSEPPSTDAALAAGVALYRLEHEINDRESHDEQMGAIIKKLHLIAQMIEEKPI